MTDEELIARLREGGSWAEPVAIGMTASLDEGATEQLCLAAADRIEALLAEKDRFAERHQRHLILGAETRARAERLERIVRLAQQWVGSHTVGGEAWHEEARAALTQKDRTDG